MPKIFRALKIPLVSIVSNILFVAAAAVVFVIYANVSQLNIEIRSPVILTKNVEDVEVTETVIEDVVIEELVVDIEEERKNKEIEDYNDSNWNVYYNSWWQTKNKLSPITACKNKIDTLRNSLEEEHKEYLRYKVKDKQSNELNLMQTVYNYSNNISNILESIASSYTLDKDEPGVLSSMFIFNNNTREDANIKLKQVLESFERTRKFSDDIECFNITEITKSNRDEICKKIVDLNYTADSVRSPIYREQFEIDEQFKLALKEYKDEADDDIEDCKLYRHVN